MPSVTYLAPPVLSALFQEIFVLQLYCLSLATSQNINLPKNQRGQQRSVATLKTSQECASNGVVCLSLLSLSADLFFNNSSNNGPIKRRRLALMRIFQPILAMVLFFCILISLFADCFLYNRSSKLFCTKPAHLKRFARACVITPFIDYRPFCLVCLQNKYVSLSMLGLKNKKIQPKNRDADTNQN